MNNKEVELNIYVDKGNESQAHHAMNSLKNAMVWDEQKYGREYDLEIYNIVAVESFNMGAMENKGLNIFNSAYVLADVTTASDANFMGVESVIAHEYFHNWTGNRITCREWFELTLKEGLTVFRDQCFSADMNSPAVQRIEDVKALRERQFVEDSSPTRHPIQPKSYISMNNFYTATVYEKGAEVIRMLHTLLGEQNYFKAMDLYFERFDGQAVRIEEFLWAMEQYGEFDLQAFRRWYDQSGTPRLHVDEVFENGVYQLTLTQEIPPALDGTPQLPHYYPLKIALYNEDGSLHQEHLLTISQEKEEFVFEGLQNHPILSINRDFSAPIIVEFAKANNPFLMQFDTNPFTQYEAAQNFALQTLQHFMKTKTIDPAYIQAYGRLLALDTDIAYKALLLELPSVSSLMQKQKDVDFDAIYKAKEALTRKIATVYEEQLTTLYTQHHKHADNSLESTAMAKRALKNRALKILSILETQKVSALAKEQYWSSANMTDTLAALDVLVHTHNDYAKKALEAA
jgi:aminopeptidase N